MQNRGELQNTFFKEIGEPSDLILQGYNRKYNIIKGSHKKIGGWDVSASRFHDHCGVLCKFGEKWSRLNLVLQPTVQGLQYMIYMCYLTIL